MGATNEAHYDRQSLRFFLAATPLEQSTPGSRHSRRTRSQPAQSRHLPTIFSEAQPFILHHALPDGAIVGRPDMNTRCRTPIMLAAQLALLFAWACTGASDAQRGGGGAASQAGNAAAGRSALGGAPA